MRPCGLPIKHKPIQVNSAPKPHHETTPLIRIRIGNNEQTLSWEEWESRVLDGRIAPNCPVQMEAVTGDKFVPARDLELYQSLVQDGAVAWRRSFTSSGPPILTALLIGIQIRIWWWARLPDFAETLISDFAKWGPSIYEKGESWRIVTMGFVHIETFHLALNMMWLAYTGWNLERALGRLNLLTIFVASVIGGSLLSLIGAPVSMSVGASGGVFGLVAASVVFGFLRPDLLPLRAQSLYGAALLPYLILMLLSGLSSEGTDNWSHIGGLITGGVLAFLLDPSPLQRRVHWNRKIQSGVAVLSVGAIMVLGLLGPRIYPLVDSEQARWSHLKSPPERSPLADPALIYRVPDGWQSAQLISGEPGFRSPIGSVGFGVRVSVTDVPMTPEEAATAWSEKLVARFPGAIVEPAYSVSVAQRSGLGVTARSESGETIVEWRVAIQGCWMLEESWEVARDQQAALSPLLTRLRAQVRWAEPSSLTNAKLAYEQLPNSINIRLAMARALAEAGYIDESLEHWTALRSEYPSSAIVQSGLLEVIRWYPERVPELETILLDVLTSKPKTGTYVDLVTTLERLGRNDQAVGLLEATWRREPGDRTLKRARRNRTLWTSLTESTNQPFASQFDLRTPSLRPLTPTALSFDDLNFDQLAELGRDHRNLRLTLAQQVHDAIPAAPTDAVRALILLKLGRPPENVASYFEGIQEDMLAPDWADWMKELASLGVDRQALNDTINVVAADPGRLPRFPRR